MIRGGILGLSSGICADIVLLSVIALLLHMDPALSEYIRQYMMVTVALILPLFGLLLTLCCTYLSVNKCLQMKSSELY